MKILIFDIETAPTKAYVWRMWKENISPDQLKQEGYVLCWSAKWLGEEKVFFDSVWNYGEVSSKNEKHCIAKLFDLLNEADIIITYNGNKFDIPVMNTSFINNGYLPPFPSKSIDLYKIVYSRFRFKFNRLNHVAEKLGLGSKIEHEGFKLWVNVLNQDKDAIKKMEEYCIQDCILTEKLYFKLRPWIKNHPNINILDDSKEPKCPCCGSSNVIKRGHQALTSGVYQRYSCNDCGSPLRGRTMLNSMESRKILLSSL